jgi:hypothetical protein
MSATQSKPRPLGSSKVEDHRSSLGNSGAATLIELGIAFAAAESSAHIEGSCSHCRAPRNPLRSTAQCPNVFCSEECEQDFVRAALASLTIEDCMRIHKRLESLLMGTQEAAL